MNTNIENLLNSVNSIRNKYEEIAKISGENFNIFKVLKLTTNEVKTHSAFIAELLNPKGIHDQGDVFLNLFIKRFDIKLSESNKCKVVCEMYIGKINEIGDEGGRMDIAVIDNNNSGFIIENKIYALEQDKQLLRYHKWGGGNFEIFFLTLLGTNSISDQTENHVKYRNLSYKTDIIEWLEDCKKEAINHSTLRETITQYIYLIKILTNQTTNNKMKNEVIEKILINEDIYNTAEDIKNGLNDINNFFLTKHNNLILENWKNKFNIKNRELVLFQFENSQFLMRPSFEENQQVFHIFPQPWGSAGKYKDIKNVISNVRNDNKPNNNYVGFIPSKYNLDKMEFTFMKDIIVNDKKEEWVNLIIQEGVQIIKELIIEIEKSELKNKITFSENVLKIKSNL